MLTELFYTAWFANDDAWQLLNRISLSERHEMARHRNFCKRKRPPEPSPAAFKSWLRR